MWTLSFSRKLVSFMWTRSTTGAIKDTFLGAGWFGGGYRFDVLQPDFFVHENEMDRGSGPRIVCVHRHIDASGMPELKSALLGSLHNARQVGACDSGVHVGCQASLLRIPLEDVNEHRHPADDTVGDCGGIEGRMKAPHTFQ
jgi:hypothetical protein